MRIALCIIAYTTYVRYVSIKLKWFHLLDVLQCGAIENDRISVKMPVVTMTSLSAQCSCVNAVAEINLGLFSPLYSFLFPFFTLRFFSIGLFLSPKAVSQIQLVVWGALQRILVYVEPW